jgi:uncharacterized protein YqiB (DUF1249 family)
MQVLAPCRHVQSPRPRSFMGLMELYEINYMRFRQLCPGVDGIRCRAVSHVEGALDLHLRILERARYTTTLTLTYYLQDTHDYGFVPNPNLKIRVYHDARQAEVLSRNPRQTELHIHTPGLGMDTELVLRWRLNRFLYKWLGYCRHQGHGFAHEPARLRRRRVESPS